MNIKRFAKAFYTLNETMLQIWT